MHYLLIILDKVLPSETDLELRNKKHLMDLVISQARALANFNTALLDATKISNIKIESKTFH